MYLDKTVEEMRKAVVRLNRMCERPVPKTKRARIARLERILTQMRIVLSLVRVAVDELTKAVTKERDRYKIVSWEGCFGAGRPIDYRGYR